MIAYLISFVLRPLRFLHLLWKSITLRGTRFHIYMKSGNVVAIDAKNVSIEKNNNGQYCRIEWEYAGLANNRLVSIDVDEIEAVVQKG